MGKTREKVRKRKKGRERERDGVHRVTAKAESENDIRAESGVGESGFKASLRRTSSVHLKRDTWKIKAEEHKSPLRFLSSSKITGRLKHASSHKSIHHTYYNNESTDALTTFDGV